MERIATTGPEMEGPSPGPRAEDGDTGDGQAVHSCGGCGAAFLVNPSVAVEPVLLGGVERVWCACCLEFLGLRLPSSHLATTPGYDAEGQVLNARFQGLTPTGRRWYRSPWTQECLEVELRTIARRRGIEPPEPLFLAS